MRLKVALSRPWSDRGKRSPWRLFVYQSGPHWFAKVVNGPLLVHVIWLDHPIRYEGVVKLVGLDEIVSDVRRNPIEAAAQAMRRATKELNRWVEALGKVQVPRDWFVGVDWGEEVGFRPNRR